MKYQAIFSAKRELSQNLSSDNHAYTHKKDLENPRHKTLSFTNASLSLNKHDNETMKTDIPYYLSHFMMVSSENKEHMQVFTFI